MTDDQPPSTFFNRAQLEAWLHRQWAHRGLFALALSPFSLIYLAASRLRFKSITPEKIAVPVVVVGNIYVGGTGKTPITIRLTKKLIEAGLKPGVISRGYARSATTVQLIDATTSARISGDEPLLIADQTQCPVAVGRDRVAAAKLLLAHHPEVNVIVSDDGLQHRHLARDIELAVVGARGLGNGWVFPAGPLREPPSRLDAVDAVVLNASLCTFESRTPRYVATCQLHWVTQLATGKKLDIDKLAAKITKEKALANAVAGIAMPLRFFSMLRAHDLDVKGLALGDHFDYNASSFRAVDGDYIFMTSKDAVKCAQIPELKKDKRLWVADLEMKLDPYLIKTIVQRVKELNKK